MRVPGATFNSLVVIIPRAIFAAWLALLVASPVCCCAFEAPETLAAACCGAPTQDEEPSESPDCGCAEDTSWLEPEAIAPGPQADGALGLPPESGLAPPALAASGFRPASGAGTVLQTRSLLIWYSRWLL